MVSDGVATFDVTKAGEIANHWNNIVGNLPDGTRIVFTPGSKINEADLTTILQSGTNNKRFYIDLFDIVGDGGPTLAQVDEWISNGVAAMKSNWQSQYGIILPYNTSLGTSAVIRWNGNTQNNGSTFTKYAAYYRDSDNANNLVLHVWDQNYWNGWGTQAAENYTTAVSHLNTHNKINEAASVTVSTIAATEFDLTQLTASKVLIEITSNDMLKSIDNAPTPNSSIPEKGNIYVRCTVPGGFAEHITSAANTENTPTDILKISGSLSQNDVKAVNNFIDGPRVLDLREASVQGAGITQSLLEQIDNSHIEYILLPEGMSKDVVCGADYSDMEGLKAVISSNSTDLVAYVKQAGSLAEARVLETGGTTSTVNVNGVAYPIFTPTTQSLQNVTLAGNLNASDLAARVNQQSAVSAVDGHLYSDASFVTSGGTAAAATDNGYTTKSGVVEGSSGLNGDSSIKSLDLTNAVFDNNNDMNFNLLGLTSLENIKLPINDEKMKTIPLGCFNNNHAMTYICIPCNYTTIGRYAFSDNTVTCITTDNPSHTFVVGGTGETFVSEEEAKEALANTFTFSQNITSIGRGAFIINNEVITDVYVMATTTPLCEKDAFSGPMLYGNNGFEGTGPYCRDKYVNGGKKITMLHYPSGDINDETYKRMEELYTDVYKIYTKKEQTGAIDANGRTIAWPTHQEMKRVFEQASVSKTWHEWKTGYDINQQVNNTESTEGYTVDNTISYGTPTYNFEGYEGWHQFTLAMANYFEPTVIPDNNQIITEYEDAGWFTFCIPFDMTKGEVLELMGVPASHGNYISKLDGEPVGQEYYPDIRQLRSVQRIKAENSPTGKNRVVFRLTTNLYRNGEPKYLTFQYPEGNENTKPTILETGTVQGDGTHTGYDQRMLIGGRPYIIKAYKRKGERIPQNNLGQYVMNRYGNKFPAAASCINDNCYEQLGSGGTTLQFAKPFENHKIQAASDADPSSTDWQTTGGYVTYDDNGTARPYYYTFVGQFWEQPLPRYCFYISKGKWYRNSTVNDYVWSPYKCVIMATPYQSDSYGWNETGKKSGKYRDDSRSFYPTVEGTDLVKGELKIGFLDGRDDDDFDKAQGKYMFMFDDDIMEYDNGEENPTAIENIDGEDLAPMPANAKVYNMSGQLVGTSLSGLDKGLYIVNGKKYVVK